MHTMMKEAGKRAVSASIPAVVLEEQHAGNNEIALDALYKECPVCHARCFADMDTCYGCLHSFDSDSGAILRVPLVHSGEDDGSESAPHSVERPLAPQDATAAAFQDSDGEQDAVQVVLAPECPAVPETAQVATACSGASCPECETGCAQAAYSAGKRTPRLDEILEIVISVHVAREARARATCATPRSLGRRLRWHSACPR